MKFDVEHLKPIQNEDGKTTGYEVADKDAVKNALKQQDVYILSKNEHDRLITQVVGSGAKELEQKVQGLEGERTELNAKLQELQSKALDSVSVEELNKVKESVNLATEQLKAKDAQLTALEGEYKAKEQRLTLENNLAAIRGTYDKTYTGNEAWSEQIKIAEQKAIDYLQSLEVVDGHQKSYKDSSGKYLIDANGNPLTSEQVLAEKLKIFVGQTKASGLPPKGERGKTSHGATSVKVDYSAIPKNNMIAFANALNAKGIVQGTDEFKTHFLNWKAI